MKCLNHKLDVWISKDGTETKFADLETDHLLNIVALLHRGWEKQNPQRSKLISLHKEVVKRLQAW